MTKSLLLVLTLLVTFGAMPLCANWAENIFIDLQVNATKYDTLIITGLSGVTFGHGDNHEGSGSGAGLSGFSIYPSYWELDNGEGNNITARLGENKDILKNQTLSFVLHLNGTGTEPKPVGRSPGSAGEAVEV